MKTQHPRMGCGTSSALARGAAFTLIDIMLLIVVIGSLLVIWLLIMPRVSSVRRTPARVQVAKTQINAFKIALDMFNADNGYYPKGMNGLSCLVTRPVGATNWHQYMDSVPLDPWGRQYIYEFPGRHNLDGFDLMSTGPDGKPGTRDDITNW